MQQRRVAAADAPGGGGGAMGGGDGDGELRGGGGVGVVEGCGVGRTADAPGQFAGAPLLLPAARWHVVAQRQQRFGQDGGALAQIDLGDRARAAAAGRVQHAQRDGHDGACHQQLQQGKAALTARRVCHWSSGSWLTCPDNQSTRKRTPLPAARIISLLPPVAPPSGRNRMAAPPRCSSRSATVARIRKAGASRCGAAPCSPKAWPDKSTANRTSRPWLNAIERAWRSSLSMVRTVSRYLADSLKRSNATRTCPLTKAMIANTTSNSISVKPRSRRMVLLACTQWVLRMSAFSPSPPGAPSAPSDRISMPPSGPGLA